MKQTELFLIFFLLIIILFSACSKTVVNQDTALNKNVGKNDAKSNVDVKLNADTQSKTDVQSTDTSDNSVVSKDAQVNGVSSIDGSSNHGSVIASNEVSTATSGQNITPKQSVQKNDYINLWIYPQDPLIFTTLDGNKHEVHLLKADDTSCTMSVDGKEGLVQKDEFVVVNNLYVKVRDINADSLQGMNTCYLGLRTYEDMVK